MKGDLFGNGEVVVNLAMCTECIAALRLELMPEKMPTVIAGLQSLRGVAKISAVTLASQLGQISRFDGPRQLMGYAGMVSGEHSSACA